MYPTDIYLLKQLSQLVLVFLLLTLNKSMPELIFIFFTFLLYNSLVNIWWMCHYNIADFMHFDTH